MSSKSHAVIIIPGLGNHTLRLRLATVFWPKHRLEPVIHPISWQSGDFGPKLDLIVAKIDELARQGNRVSLVGTSAGGSAVMNAFAQRRSIIYRVVNVCGRLRTGPMTGFRSFAAKTASSRAFAQSVRLSERVESTFSAADRKKILTIRSQFGDELVPPETTGIVGATNIQVPMIEHGLSIMASLTIFSSRLIKFLADE